MLVLSRKSGEQIEIGDSIRITVVSVHGGKVRLGIEAPPDVVIRRAELEETPRSAPAAATAAPFDYFRTILNAPAQ